jgi:hypothetical protein
LMILQLRQMRLTDAITFMILPFFQITSPGTRSVHETDRKASIQPLPCRLEECGQTFIRVLP